MAYRPIHALTCTSRPCLRGSSPSAARSANWSTPRIPRVGETIKRTNRPYFVLEGNVAALVATKDHVNVFLYDEGLTPDPEGIITGGHHNTTARTVAIRQGDTLNVPALTAMVKHIIATNRAGGWRRVKRAGDATENGDTR